MASFKSFLSAVGHGVQDVFKWLGSSQGQAAISATENAVNIAVSFANPALGAGLVGIEQLINSGLKQAVGIEALSAAAGQQSGSGAQKAAAVTSSIAPNVAAFLKSIGISNATAQQEQELAVAINNGLVAILNAIPPIPSVAG